MHGTEEKMKNFNMMKKLLALTLGAAMLLAVMTGCGKKTPRRSPLTISSSNRKSSSPPSPPPCLSRSRPRARSSSAPKPSTPL